MDFLRKTIIGAVVGSVPLLIGAVINLMVEQAALAQSLTDVKGEFLRTVERIDRRLIRIENKIDEK